MIFQPLKVALLMLALLLPHFTYARYYIQDDCSAEERDFLEEAFRSSKQVVEDALKFIDEDSEDTKRLFGWLFGTRPGIDVPKTVKTNLQGALAACDPVNDENALKVEWPFRDVRIFCTHKRLKKHNFDGEEHWYDTGLGSLIKGAWDCSNAMAYTLSPNRRLGEDESKNDIIQICPWYLKFGMHQSQQFQLKWTALSVARVGHFLKLDKLAAKGLFTPIDLFMLWEKVLIHELMHTRAGGQLDDVTGFSSYGWKKTRQMSNNRNGDVDRKGRALPVTHKNADSVALFASVANLMTKGIKVDENGNIKPLKKTE